MRRAVPLGGASAAVAGMVHRASRMPMVRGSAGGAVDVNRVLQAGSARGACKKQPVRGAQVALRGSAAVQCSAVGAACEGCHNRFHRVVRRIPTERPGNTVSSGDGGPFHWKHQPAFKLCVMLKEFLNVTSWSPATMRERADIGLLQSPIFAALVAEMSIPRLAGLGVPTA